MRKIITTSCIVIVGVLVSLWIAARAVDLGPKGRIVLATGGADGIYDALARNLVKDAAAFGVDIQLRPDLEGLATVSALVDADGQIDGGFVKGGVSGSMQGRFASMPDRRTMGDQFARLHSLGRLFHEPIWVFYRGPAHAKNLRSFVGKKILIGSATSGSRLVVSQLLKANGVDSTNSTLIDNELPDDAAPLLHGDVDVAFVIASPEAGKVQKLLRVPDILLMDFSAEADAYAIRFPYVSKLVLRQGVVEFHPELPTADITLLSTDAALIVRRDLHPALSSILTTVLLRNPKSGFDPAGDPIVFYRAGEFPSGKDPEFDIAPEAAQIYKSSDTSLLLRSMAPVNRRLGLPFWVSAFIYQHGTQTLLLLIPLLSILVPMSRLIPMLYNWAIKRRLTFWYEKLKDLEIRLDNEFTEAQRAEKISELDRIDNAVKRIRVPSHASDQLYDLRGHIELVRQKMMPRSIPMA